MNDHDEELQKLLRQWKAPASRPALDERVWRSVRQSERSLGVSWSASARKWLPVAAVLFVAATLWLGHRAPAPEPAPKSEHDVSIKSTTDATGFRPVANDSITVVKLGETR